MPPRPLPHGSAEMLRSWVDEQTRDGVVGWPAREKRIEAIRYEVARLVGAERDEIAFVASTTHGIGLIAEGFPWREGDTVVSAEDEYPSNLYPWMNLASRGVSLRLVPSRDGRIWIDDLIAAIDRSTRLLAISHVEFATGFRNDLDALADACHARGVALFVDAIQGLGPLTVDVRQTPIDFMAADGHKWLLGPEGAGLLFVRRDWIDRLRPTGVGWHSVVGSYNSPRNEFRLKASAHSGKERKARSTCRACSHSAPAWSCFSSSVRRPFRAVCSTGRRPSASWPPRRAGPSRDRRARPTARPSSSWNTPASAQTAQPTSCGG